MLGDQQEVKAKFESNLLRDYSEWVDELAKNGDEAVIENLNGQYASVVIKNLIIYAKHSIRIVSECLKLYRNEEILSAAEQFLCRDKSSKITAILTGSDLQGVNEMPFVQLAHAFPGQIDIREAAKEVGHHFVVMDETGYRYCIDKSKDQAIASFNSPKVAKNLAEQFDKILPKYPALDIPPPAQQAVSNTSIQLEKV